MIYGWDIKKIGKKAGSFRIGFFIQVSALEANEQYRTEHFSDKFEVALNYQASKTSAGCSIN